MGSQQSQAIIGTSQDWERKQQKRKQQQSGSNKQRLFYKVQNCSYPHPLLQKQSKKQKNKQQVGRKRCTMKHDGYHSSFNLCSHCQQYPQKLTKNRKLIYEKSDYTVKKSEPQRYGASNSTYRQKEVGAPGPQVPGFYNGFSLPVQRYYKHRSPITDYQQHKSGSIYRNESNKIQQSIYEQLSQKNPSKLQIDIDYQGFQQNLRL